MILQSSDLLSLGHSISPRIYQEQIAELNFKFKTHPKAMPCSVSHATSKIKWL